MLRAPQATLIALLWLILHSTIGSAILTMRIVFISLEFTAGTFSGNGVYATSQVKLACCFSRRTPRRSQWNAADSDMRNVWDW
jgi:hypothetical protein